jgi:glycosyltransferase involved in cell wall biosynthesis
MGHQITVLCPKPRIIDTNYSQHFKDVKFNYVSGYKSIKVPTDLVHRLRQLATLMIKLNHLLNTERFDLIRAISLIPGYIASMLSQKYHIPTITNVSDFYSDLYKHSELPFSSVASHILRKMEETVVKKSDVFIVDSPIQRKYWAERGLNEKRGVVIPHGIYPDRFNTKADQETVRKKYGINATTKIIYYHGDISHQDGVDVLIDSAPYVIQNNENVRFMIVGTGTEKYMRKLRTKIEDYRVQKFFIFPGWVPHFFIPQYIATADLCVAPFRLALTSNTSLSNKIIEYLAMRKPVVASRGAGTKEMIGDTVVYVDPENPQELADAIIKILTREPMKSIHQVETIISRLNWVTIMNHEEDIIAHLPNIEKVDFRKFDYFLQ